MSYLRPSALDEPLLKKRNVDAKSVQTSFCELPDSSSRRNAKFVYLQGWISNHIRRLSLRDRFALEENPLLKLPPAFLHHAIYRMFLKTPEYRENELSKFSNSFQSFINSLNYSQVLDYQDQMNPLHGKTLLQDENPEYLNTWEMRQECVGAAASQQCHDPVAVISPVPDPAILKEPEMEMLPSDHNQLDRDVSGQDVEPPAYQRNYDGDDFRTITSYHDSKPCMKLTAVESLIRTTCHAVAEANYTLLSEPRPLPKHPTWDVVIHSELPVCEVPRAYSIRSLSSTIVWSPCIYTTLYGLAAYRVSSMPPTNWTPNVIDTSRIQDYVMKQRPYVQQNADLYDIEDVMDFVDDGIQAGPCDPGSAHVP